MRSVFWLPLLFGCFPELPDELLIADLRVLAVRVDPATARLDQWPPPTITLSALVVDPEDEELADVTHTWRLELGDEAEGLDGLIPEGPWGASVTLNLGALFARDVHLQPGALPIGYTASNDTTHRDAVKLVHFLFPEEPGDDDSAAAGDDDDSAAIAELVNDSPRLIALEVPGLGSWAEADLPGPDAPLVLELEDASAGLTITTTAADDGDLDAISVRLYRTSGCDGLPLEDGLSAEGGGGISGGGTGDGDPCGHVEENDGLDFGGPEEDEDPAVHSFEWTPWDGETGLGTRLFVVLLDGDGAQTWQELRVGG
jgi:hypothetical protein